MQFRFRNSSFHSFRFLPVACLVLISVASSAFAQAPAKNAVQGALTMDKVLAGMDQAASHFQSVEADLEYTKVTVIVDDHSTERGKIYFDRNNGKLRMMLAFQQPAEKYVLFSGGKVSIYQPKIAEVDEYNVANNQGLLEQFLLLGFGTSGADLQKSYQIKLVGEEQLEGEPTVHLDLTPKNPQVAARLQRVELWLSPKTWQPLQQKFYEPSKDYLIARYRNIKENAKIPSKNFQLPLRGKVKTVRPQGS